MFNIEEQYFLSLIFYLNYLVNNPVCQKYCTKDRYTFFFKNNEVNLYLKNTLFDFLNMLYLTTVSIYVTPCVVPLRISKGFRLT